MFGAISCKERVSNRKIAQEVGRSWECDCCHITLDKDTNAASNSKRIGGPAGQPCLKNLWAGHLPLWKSSEAGSASSSEAQSRCVVKRTPLCMLWEYGKKAALMKRREPPFALGNFML